MAEKEYLCKCNNCGSILIDTNPQADAKRHSLKGRDLKTLLTIEDMQACPLCLTDAYLTDDLGEQATQSGKPDSNTGGQ